MFLIFLKKLFLITDGINHKEKSVYPLPPQQTEIRIKGVLIPVAWETTGKITCLAVATFDEKEYRIRADGLDGQWQDLLSKMVTVEGVPYEKDGLQWFSARSIQPINQEIRTCSSDI